MHRHQSIAHSLRSRARRFHFGESFFDALGFGLQVLQVRFQLRDAFGTCHVPSLKTNFGTMTAAMTLARAHALFVAAAFALRLLLATTLAPSVMLSVSARMTATLVVMTVVLMTLSAHVFHLVLPYELGMSVQPGLPHAWKVQILVRPLISHSTLCDLANNLE